MFRRYIGYGIDMPFYGSRLLIPKVKNCNLRPATKLNRQELG